MNKSKIICGITLLIAILIFSNSVIPNTLSDISNGKMNLGIVNIFSYHEAFAIGNTGSVTLDKAVYPVPFGTIGVDEGTANFNKPLSNSTTSINGVFPLHKDIINGPNGGLKSTTVLKTGNVIVHIRVNDPDFNKSTNGIDHIAVGVNDNNHGPVAVQILRQGNSMLLATAGGSAVNNGVIVNLGGTALPNTGATTWSQVRDLGPMSEISPIAGIFQADLPIELTDGPAGNDCPAVTSWDATKGGRSGFSPTVTDRFNEAPSSGNYCVRQGDIITVTYTDTSNASNHTQTVTDSAIFDLRNGVLQSDKSVYNINSDMILTLVEPDFNFDSQTAETAPLDLIEWDSHAFKNTIGQLGGQINAFDPIPITFVETGKDTGIFQSIIKIPNTLQGNMLAPGEQIRLEYTDWGPAGSKTVGVNNGNIDRTIFTSNVGATIELDQKTYTWTDRVFITIVAPDRDFDPNLIDTINATISTNLKTLHNYKLVETGVNTGIFTGDVILTGDPNILQFGVDGSGLNPTGAGPTGTGPTDGFLPSEGQDNITATFNLVSGSIVTSSLIKWNVGEIKWLETSYPTNDKGVLQIVDPDMNLNPKAVDKFDTKVWSDSDSGGIKLTMTETGEATGIFQGTVDFDAHLLSSGNILHVSQGDTVTGGYTDVTLPQSSAPGNQLKLTAVTLIRNTELSEPLTFNKLNIMYSPTPPKFTQQQLEQINANLEKTDLPDVEVLNTNQSFSPAIPGFYTEPGSITNVGFSGKDHAPKVVFISQENSYQPISFGTFSLPLNESVPIDPNTTTIGSKLEPSVAHSTDGNNIIFLTTNIFNAKTTDNSNNWSYFDSTHSSNLFLLNPCDQDVIYDQNRQMFIWIQLGDSTNTTPRDTLRVATSSDAANWIYTDITPSKFPSWSSLGTGVTAIWDYPQIAITNDHLIITTNVMVMVPGTPATKQNAILRISLNDLKNNPVTSSQIEEYNTNNPGTISPVQGAQDTIYLAAQTAQNDHLQVYIWPENTSVQSNYVHNPDPWNTGGIQCTSGAVDNWCHEAKDSRILNGWKVGNRIGFFWNAPSDGASFPHPYVNAAMFDISSGISYVGRPYIASLSAPWMYANGYPTSQGLGWMAFTGNNFPIAQVNTLDSASLTSFTLASPKPWGLAKFIASSNHGGIAFGDYVRVRSYDQNNCRWFGAGNVFLGTVNQPFITVFGPSTCAGAGSSGTAPSPPSGLHSTKVTSSKVDLEWNPPTNFGGKPITDYILDRSTDGGTTWHNISDITGSPPDTKFPDTTVASKTVYIYRVSAVNMNGPSGASLSPSITTPDGGICAGASAFGDDLPNHQEPTPQLQTLKDFRDNSIVSTTVGADFMKVFNPVYFTLGSPIAYYEQQNPWFQQIVKYSIYPMLYILEFSEKPFDYIHGEFGILSYGIVTSLLIGGVYLAPFALSVKQVRKNKFNYKIAIMLISVILIVILAAELNNNHYALMASTSLFVLSLLSISAILVAKLIYRVNKILRRV